MTELIESYPKNSLNCNPSILTVAKDIEKLLQIEPKSITKELIKEKELLIKQKLVPLLDKFHENSSDFTKDDQNYINYIAYKCLAWIETALQLLAS